MLITISLNGSDAIEQLHVLQDSFAASGISYSTHFDGSEYIIALGNADAMKAFKTLKDGLDWGIAYPESNKTSRGVA